MAGIGGSVGVFIYKAASNLEANYGSKLNEISYRKRQEVEEILAKVCKEHSVVQKVLQRDYEEEIGLKMPEKLFEYIPSIGKLNHIYNTYLNWGQALSKSRKNLRIICTSFWVLGGGAGIAILLGYFVLKLKHFTLFGWVIVVVIGVGIFFGVWAFLELFWNQGKWDNEYDQFTKWAKKWKKW